MPPGVIQIATYPHMAESQVNAWPDLGTQPPKQNKRFPKANPPQRSAPSTARKAVNGAAVGHKPQASCDLDLGDLTSPVKVPEPDESEHSSRVQATQTDLEETEKRLVRTSYTRCSLYASSVLNPFHGDRPNSTKRSKKPRLSEQRVAGV